MSYNLTGIELSLDDEYMLNKQIEQRKNKYDKSNIYYFERAMKGYKNFDFTSLAELDKIDDEDRVKEKFDMDKDLASRPLLFTMYMLHRNGFLGDYFNDKKRVMNICRKDINRLDIPDNVPEAIVTDDGMLYGIGKDGHIWLYYFLNLMSVDTTDCMRYGNFTDDVTKKRFQFFSRLKELLTDSKPLYVSEQQAIVLNNLRRKYEPLTSLQSLLLNNTADMGFRMSDSAIALKINFETFADTFPEEYMDLEEVLEIRKSRKIIANSRVKS